VPMPPPSSSSNSSSDNNAAAAAAAPPAGDTPMAPATPAAAGSSGSSSSSSELYGGFLEAQLAELATPAEMMAGYKPTMPPQQLQVCVLTVSGGLGWWGVCVCVWWWGVGGGGWVGGGTWAAQRPWREVWAPYFWGQGLPWVW
jgi:hypothetical protein